MTWRMQAIFLILCMMLSSFFSCTSLSEDRMIPDTTERNFKNSWKTLKVSILEGNILDDGNKSFEEKNLEDKMLEKVLITTMIQSGIFKNVVSKGLSDYELIVKKERQVGRFDLNYSGKAILAIDYIFQESQKNDVLWKETIHSMGMCSIKEEFNASTRSNRALERALKKNLEQCVQRISDNLPQI